MRKGGWRSLLNNPAKQRLFCSYIEVEMHLSSYPNINLYLLRPSPLFSLGPRPGQLTDETTYPSAYGKKSSRRSCSSGDDSTSSKHQVIHLSVDPSIYQTKQVASVPSKRPTSKPTGRVPSKRPTAKPSLLPRTVRPSSKPTTSPTRTSPGLTREPTKYVCM